MLRQPYAPLKFKQKQFGKLNHRFISCIVRARSWTERSGVE